MFLPHKQIMIIIIDTPFLHKVHKISKYIMYKATWDTFYIFFYDSVYGLMG